LEPSGAEPHSAPRRGREALTARAPTHSALIVGLCATVAGFGVVSSLAHWAIAQVVLPAPLPSQHQDAESVAFIGTFAVLLPLAAIFAPRALDRVAARHGEGIATDLALALGIALCVLLAAGKVAERAFSASGVAMLFAGSVLWLALAAAGLVILLRREIHAGAIQRIAPALPAVLAASVAAVALCFAQFHSITPVPLVAGLVIAAAAGYLVAFRQPTLPRPSRGLLVGADVVALVLIALAVPNLVVFTPEDPSASLQTTIIQFHQDFFLGPANALVGGGTMLVDVVSQYGVGSILFLAGVFKLIPIGNGTLAFTEGVLAAGMFCLAYVTLRLAGAGRILAWATLAVAVVVLVFNLVYPLGALLQHGAFRFGMPMVILAAAAWEARAERGRTALWVIQVATVGIASLWALEAFLYCVGAIVGLVAFRAATAPAGRLRIVARSALQVLAACVVVQVVFAVATLIGAGQLPDWGDYLKTLHEFLSGPVGDLTYDFSAWSAGLAIGAIYAASALAIVLVLLREPELVAANRRALLVLSGMTGYGIALFSYFVNRSAEHIVPYVSLPAVLVVALWLSIVLRDWRFSPLTRGAGVAAAAAAAALLIAAAWSNVGLRFSQSALAIAAPGGKSLSGSLDRLWHPPPLAPGATDAERLLRTYMPGEHESVVLTSADLSVEALMRTGRVNEIPLSDPWEDSLLPDLHTADVEDAVAKLRPGQLMLIDGASREVLKSGAAGPSGIVPAGIASLQALALRRIDERFKLGVVARSPSGVEVVELRPR
jgi:hypothetical protein